MSSHHVLSSSVLFPGVGLSGASHRNDVRLQKAGEDSREEEERGSHGAQRETDTGRAGQSICGEISVTLFLFIPLCFPSF